MPEVHIEPLLTIEEDTGAAGTVSVFGDIYTIKSPTVKEASGFLDLQTKLEAYDDDTSLNKETFSIIVEMLLLLLPEIKRETIEKLSIAKITELMQVVSNAAFTPTESKKK